MIVLSYINHRVAPIVLCDACGKRITDGAMAGVMNTVETIGLEEGAIIPALYGHKGKCLDTLEQQIKDSGVPVPGWQELGAHLCYLIHNVGFEPDDLEKYDASYLP